MSSDYHIYYDHGKKTDDNQVCRPTPFFNNKCTTASTLSYVDIVISEIGNKKVKFLCEIEESGAAPKKIIGDIVNILISNKISIKGEYYTYDKPQLILGLKVTEGGKSMEKARDIKSKLDDLIKGKSWNLLDEIIIICDKDINNLIHKVELKIMDIFEKDIA